MTFERVGIRTWIIPDDLTNACSAVMAIAWWSDICAASWHKRDEWDASVMQALAPRPNQSGENLRAH